MINKFKRDFSGWLRWLHIYISMLSFAALLFFAITGITLNHTSWIEGKQKTEQFQGKLPMDWISSNNEKVEELKIVEFFRNNYSIRSPLSDFSTDAAECSLSFKGPGFNADGFIDRSSGDFEVSITRYGLIAVLNDLHKGRDSGKAWAWLIDISALLMIFVSVSGFMMIFYLKKRRRDGLIISFIGTIILFLVYYLLV
jgi:hypothetical protein